MKTMRIQSPGERLAARRQGEARAQRTLIELLCIVSILRTALTRVLPLAGCASWWVTLVSLLPGLGLYALAAFIMRFTHAGTLTGLLRKSLGRLGGWLNALVLAALLFTDGLATLTALVTLFTEGIGSRGTQLTLALLTSAVLLFSLHREGLPRAVYLLRGAMLAAALVAAAFAVPAVRGDGFFPLLGDGSASLQEALRAGMSLGWPLLLLLTLPEEGSRERVTAPCRVVLVTVAVPLFLCLTVPHESLLLHHSLAQGLMLPGRFASSAVRTLSQSLMMLAFFLAIGGAVQLGADCLCAPWGCSPRWLPYAALLGLTATQALDTPRLWRLLGSLEPWLLLPLGLLAAVCLPISLLRRDVS